MKNLKDYCKLIETKGLSQHHFRGLRRKEARERTESRLLKLQLELAIVKHERDSLIKELVEWQNWWPQRWFDPVMNVEKVLEAVCVDSVNEQKDSGYQNDYDYQEGGGYEMGGDDNEKKDDDKDENLDDYLNGNSYKKGMGNHTGDLKSGDVHNYVCTARQVNPATCSSVSSTRTVSTARKVRPSTGSSVPLAVAASAAKKVEPARCSSKSSK